MINSTSAPTASLSPSPTTTSNQGQLKISYNPSGSGAIISSLNSDFIVYKENEPLEFNLPAGKYWLTVYRQNYENYSASVIIESNKTQELTVNLNYLGSDIEEGGPPGKSDAGSSNPNNLIPNP